MLSQHVCGGGVELLHVSVCFPRAIIRFNSSRRRDALLCEGDPLCRECDNSHPIPSPDQVCGVSSTFGWKCSFLVAEYLYRNSGNQGQDRHPAKRGGRSEKNPLRVGFRIVTTGKGLFPRNRVSSTDSIGLVIRTKYADSFDLM